MAKKYYSNILHYFEYWQIPTTTKSRNLPGLRKLVRTWKRSSKWQSSRSFHKKNLKSYLFCFKLTLPPSSIPEILTHLPTIMTHVITSSLTNNFGLLKRANKNNKNWTWKQQNPSNLKKNIKILQILLPDKLVEL